MLFFFLLLGDWTNLFILLFLFSILSVIIFMCLNVKKCSLKIIHKGWFRQDISFQIMLFGVLVFIFASLVFYLFVWVNRVIIYWSWILSSGVLQIFSGLYPNLTLIFSYPTDLWKVVVRLLVGFSYLFESIYFFAWSKYPSSYSFKAFFCWFLNCV